MTGGQLGRLKEKVMCFRQDGFKEVDTWSVNSMRSKDADIVGYHVNYLVSLKYGGVEGYKTKLLVRNEVLGLLQDWLHTFEM